MVKRLIKKTAVYVKIQNKLLYDKCLDAINQYNKTSRIGQYKTAVHEKLLRSKL
jgi:hypothetical protein